MRTVERTRATQPGPRSVDVLDWLARIGASTPEPIGWALGMAIDTVHSHLRRLETAGWIERAPTLRGGPHLAFPSRRGMRVVGRPWVGERRRVPGQWEHAIDTAWTAAWLAGNPACRWWRHEREFATSTPPLDADPERWQISYLATTSGGASVTTTRRPDLVADLGGHVTAIEVERSVKSKRRLDAISGGWATAVADGSVDRVMWVVPSTDSHVARALAGSRARVRSTVLGVDEQLDVVSLDDITEAMRRRGVPAPSIGTGGAEDAEPRPEVVALDA